MHKRVDTGETFPAEVLLSAMELDGKPVLQAVVRDITERRRTEDKLRQLSRAVEQSPASIVITNPAGDIEYVNPKFVQVTGYTLAEALGKNPRILKSGEMNPENYRQMWEIIASGKEWNGEFHNKKKNGELYWEIASISPIRDLAGRITHYVAVKEDITARKQNEVERDQLIQDLHDALANVKALSGLLPICASCKKIRDDKGYWSQVESYIQQHSEATFTHGICPDCIKKLYPDLVKNNLGESKKTP
jgi:PAS domain S-box-containing protein